MKAVWLLFLGACFSGCLQDPELKVDMFNYGDSPKPYVLTIQGSSEITRSGNLAGSGAHYSDRAAHFGLSLDAGWYLVMVTTGQYSSSCAIEHQPPASLKVDVYETQVWVSYYALEDVQEVPGPALTEKKCDKWPGPGVKDP